MVDRKPPDWKIKLVKMSHPAMMWFNDHEGVSVGACIRTERAWIYDGDGARTSSRALRGRMAGYSEKWVVEDDCGKVRIYDIGFNQIGSFRVQGKVVAVNNESLITEDSGHFREYDINGDIIREYS